MLDEVTLNEENTMLDEVILTEEVSSKNERPNRQPRSKDQLIKCQFCPKSFSALRWNTGKRSFQNYVTPFWGRASGNCDDNSILIKRGGSKMFQNSATSFKVDP